MRSSKVSSEWTMLMLIISRQVPSFDVDGDGMVLMSDV